MNVDMITDFAGEDGETTGVVDILAPDENPCRIEPRVRIREEHNISRRDIDPDALKVLYRLARNNYIAYLVGGGVRDLLLGRKPKDFDISTNARPEQIRALFRNCILIGRRFRLAHIRYGSKIIETSTFRRTPETTCDPADPDADLFQRDDNLFGSPQEDALRRDFTVNGLFYDIESFSIIDYVGGMEDLAARLIRSIGDPCIRFREDPVRMIRAIRFASRLAFDIEEDTLDAIRKHGEELAKASPARLLEEITRLFAFASGERAVRLLHSTGLLKVILPEVSDCLERDEEAADALWNRLKALDRGDTVLPDPTPALIFSTLLLDPLKRKLERDWPADNFPRLKFDKVHAFLEPLSQRLRFPRKLIDRIVHIYLAQSRFASPGGKRGSISNFVTQDSFHESLALAEILHTADGRSQQRLVQWREMLAERIYGRDETEIGGSDHRRVEEGNGDQRHGDNGSAGKMSRSARRRHNKRLKRLHGREHGDNGNGRSEPEAAIQLEAAATPRTPAEAPRADTLPAVHGPAAAEPAVAEETEQKTKKGRGRRERSRKKPQHAARDAAAETIGKPGEEAVRPLTAADFWNTPEPEPEPAPEPEAEAEPMKKGRGGRKAKGAAKEKAKAEEPEERKDEKPKPLRMDKADEADIPMHWLDEI